MQLPLDDEVITKAAVYLQPFLDDDDRIECAMYPVGSAVQFIEQGWGGDPRKYVQGFVDAMGRDYARWQAMVREAGEDARRTLSDSFSLDQEEQWQRVAPTSEELLRFAAQLSPEEAGELLAKAHPAPQLPLSRGDELDAGPPVYLSWEDFLDRTTPSQRMEWCRKKAAKANKRRLMSGVPDVRITGADVMAVLDLAKGRCGYCGSLAVENRPSTPSGKPLPWGHVGRRVGSLSHRVARFNGGCNAPANLIWACLWCNTWPQERRLGASDHGGIQPRTPGSGEKDIACG